MEASKKEEDKKVYPLKPFPSVYLEVGLNKNNIFGIIELELFSDTPKTSENFRQLCTGEKGFGKANKMLHKQSKLPQRHAHIQTQGA